MAIAIKNAGLLLTLDRGKIIENCSVLIEDNVITKITKNAITAEERIDARNFIVMPGLINAHTHVPMSILRSYADDLPLMEWLQNYIWPIEAKMKEEHINAGALLGISEMLKNGITCFNDMYWHENVVAKACEKANIRACISTPLLDVLGPEQRGRLITEGEALIKKYKKNNLIKPFFGPHAPYTCSEELLIKAKELAEKHDTRLHIHVSETKEEVENIKKEKKKTPFEYLSDIGFLSERVIAAHANYVSEKEIEIIKKCNASIVHNPISNLKLATGIAPVNDYIKEGINLALGTDSAASNNSLDMLETMKFCALIHKGINLNPAVLKSDKLLELACLNAARALGYNNLGKIKENYLADIIMLDLNSINMTPLFSKEKIYSHLVYAAKSRDVVNVIVNGIFVVENRELITLDEEKIKEDARKKAQELLDKVHERTN